MQRDDLLLWLRLASAQGVGSVACTKLLAAFGLPESIFAQSAAQLARVVSPEQAAAVLTQRPEQLELLEKTWTWLHDAPQGQCRHVLSLADAQYPRLLLALPDPPPLLFVMGAPHILAQIASKELASDIAIVGSRNATPQGLANARSFAQSFAAMGMHIVSGLALGIDGAAHEGALDAQRSHGARAGSTIAIVGTGLDRVYPKRHLDLAHRIGQHGLIMSEFLIGTAPRPENFPRRNRMIAALTQGTLVVEAAIQSGSLITARQALEFGKEVFAIPGSIHSPHSKGCHHLIKQGAKLVESAQDVLEELPCQTFLTASATQAGAGARQAAPCAAPTSEDDANPSALIRALGHDPIGFDVLIERTGIAAPTLQVQLLELELTGDVARLPGGMFQRLARA